MTRASLVALAITVALGAVIVAGRGGSVVTETLSEPLGAAAELDATIAMGAGRLLVRTADSPNAFEARLTHHTSAPVRVTYDNGALRISDEPLPLGGFGQRANDWTVDLTRRVPIELAVRVGSGSATLDLTGMTGAGEIRVGSGAARVTFGEGSGVVRALTLQAGSGRVDAEGLGHARVQRVDAQVGSGRLRLDFAGLARGTVQARARAGSGRIEVIVPQGVGLRISGSERVGRGLSGLRQIDGAWVNDAWAAADVRVEVEASVGSGRLVVGSP